MMFRPTEHAKFRKGLLAALALGATLALAAPAAAGEPNYLKVSTQAMGATQFMALEVNKSIIVDLPASATEVIASQPAIANVIMRSKTRALVQGVTGGDTNIFFLDANGRYISVLDIKVYQPRSDVGNALEAAIARNIPGSRIKVESVILDEKANRVVLTGTALSQDDLTKATLMAVQFAGDEKNVANIATVSGGQQVKLKVVVAEVQRDTVKQLGINLDGSITVNALTLGFENTPSIGGASGVANTNGISANIAAGPFALDASLRALERRGALRTLAEPTLTAISGQEASFLAGGEFPVPTDVSDGNITYTFKEFGVKLSFTPTVKSNGQIGLAVNTDVSELTTEGGISAGGITIPATKKRQASTSVEMPSGQTLAIAGMLQDTVRQQVNAFPGLGNVPILGALFRSRDFIHSQTELVILVTPYLAEPGPAPQLPTDNFQVAGDAEAIFLGHMETMYGVDGATAAGNYSGSVGFVLD